MIGYRFDESPGASGFRGNVLSNLNVQLGARNVFNKLPPIDAWYVTNFYLSPFGDTRLRSLWLSVRKGW